MVKNREELIKVAQSNANQMKGHLRKAVGDFLNAQGVSPEELAYVLGITNDEMHQILEGDGNVSVDVLSKLLVATDMAVEVKPVRNTPLKGYGLGMPRSGGFPGPGGVPVDENGRIMPPPPGFNPRFMAPPTPGMFRPREERAVDNARAEVPMETNVPVRDSHGRFVKRSTVRKPATSTRQRPAADVNPYANIGDAELINIIRQNIWDGEIDVETANHEELAAFVANKERIMRERNGKAERKEEKRVEVPVNGGGSTLNQFIEMLGNVAKEAESNPALMEAIQRFMPRK